MRMIAGAGVLIAVLAGAVASPAEAQWSRGWQDSERAARRYDVERQRVEDARREHQERLREFADRAERERGRMDEQRGPAERGGWGVMPDLLRPGR